MWRNAWAGTQATSWTRKQVPGHADSGPPTIQLAAKIQPRNNRKVTWTRTAVLAIVPILSDQDMRASAPKTKHGALSNTVDQFLRRVATTAWPWLAFCK